MAHGSNFKIGIIGGGPAGCICAYFLQKQADVTIFECSKILKTLLPTGGGRCNLAHAEFDFRELAANYPRGEKFLYSVFSKFSTSDTLDFFHNIDVDTYIQDDMRIFPVSNSSADVREKFIKALNNVSVKSEKVLRINQGENLTIVTECASYNYDFAVIATGGHASYNICKYLGHKVIPPVKALVGLKTKENLSDLAGVSVKINGEDLLFTHNGISGPYVYRISSLNARKKFPYTISLDFCGKIDLQSMLNQNPHKSVKNLLAELVPKSFAEHLLKELNIPSDTKSHSINGKQRDRILELLDNYKLTIVDTASGGEVVTCGGVCIDEVNAKTMESKLVNNVYFCGEVLDIDGFCGGFNLQNCWSTGFAAAEAIMEKIR